MRASVYVHMYGVCVCGVCGVCSVVCVVCMFAVCVCGWVWCVRVDQCVFVCGCVCECVDVCVSV